MHKFWGDVFVPFQKVLVEHRVVVQSDIEIEALVYWFRQLNC